MKYQLHIDEGKCSRGAALLLMKVREIAIHEIHDVSPCDQSTDDINIITPKQRCRTVSLDIGPQLPVISKSSSDSFSRDDFDAAIVEVDEDSDSIVLPANPVFPCTSSKKLVGTTVRTSTIRGVLRKKFSWKSYPELEAFLVENRPQYMEYSSQLNYTAEQKRYNNTLTQGLLDLAAEEGYIFEGFTFSAIRDRIRCYYKSFVQANKKKKKRRKHSK
jgi:hypothetical protein